MTDADLFALETALLLAASRASNIAQCAEPDEQPHLRYVLVAPIDAVLNTVRVMRHDTEL